MKSSRDGIHMNLYRISAQAPKVYFTHFKSLGKNNNKIIRMGKEFVSLASLIGLCVCLAHYTAGIEDKNFSHCGQSMDFGIRQISLNTNLFSF